MSEKCPVENCQIIYTNDQCKNCSNQDWTNGLDYLFPTTWIGIGKWNITKIKEDKNNE